MTRRRFRGSLLLAITIIYAIGPGFAAELQSRGASIVVNQHPLAGARSFAEQRGDRLFLPVASVARALGDQIRVNPLSRTVTAQRQDGTVAVFDGQSSEVRENGTLILALAGTSDLVFPPSPEDLLLPVEIVSVLLDVSIVWERSRGQVRVTRGEIEAEQRTGAKHRPVEIANAEYDYNYRRQGTSSSNDLRVRTSGRVGDDVVSATVNHTTSGRFGSAYTRGNVTDDRKNQQRYVAGDFGTGTQIRSLSAAVRGIEGVVPLGNVKVSTFAGTAPAVNEEFDSASPRTSNQNARLLGVMATYTPRPLTDAIAKGRQFSLSAAATTFQAPQQAGHIVAGAVQSISPRTQVDAEVAAGQFSRQVGTLRTNRSTGMRAEVSIATNIHPSLIVNAAASHVDPSFTPPVTANVRPATIVSAGVSWKPSSWMASSLSGTRSKATDGSRTDMQTIGANVTLTPGGLAPTVSVSHSDVSGTAVNRREFTLMNITKDFHRFGYFANATRNASDRGASIFPGESNIAVQIGARFRVANQSFQASQTRGTNTLKGAGIDWQSPAIYGKVSVGASYGYVEQSSFHKREVTRRVNLDLHLPFGHRLILSAGDGPGGRQLTVSIPAGRLMHRRPVQVANARTIEEMKAFAGRVSGRVYQDTNVNGRFDTEDKPQANVRVLLDRNQLAITDERGEFQFSDVAVGSHTVSLDLLSVRADLSLLDSTEKAIRVSSDRDTLNDFRVVRTGRVSGRIWLDANRNGKFDEGEEALADVRVVAGTSRDTLTGDGGRFILSDMPPGEYVLVVDAKTLPRLKEPLHGVTSVQIHQGGETSSVDFPIVDAEPEVKVFAAAEANSKIPPGNTGLGRSEEH